MIGTVCFFAKNQNLFPNNLRLWARSFRPQISTLKNTIRYTGKSVLIILKSLIRFQMNFDSIRWEKYSNSLMRFWMSSTRWLRKFLDWKKNFHFKFISFSFSDCFLSQWIEFDCVFNRKISSLIRMKKWRWWEWWGRN